MASALDRKFDETLAAVTGPGGRVVIDRDKQGRKIVGNFPATLPDLFRTFCALNAQTEALVSGELATGRLVAETTDAIGMGRTDRWKWPEAPCAATTTPGSAC